MQQDLSKRDDDIKDLQDRERDLLLMQDSKSSVKVKGIAKHFNDRRSKPNRNSA